MINVNIYNPIELFFKKKNTYTLHSHHTRKKKHKSAFQNKNKTKQKTEKKRRRKKKREKKKEKQKEKKMSLFGLTRATTARDDITNNKRSQQNTQIQISNSNSILFVFISHIIQKTFTIKIKFENMLSMRDVDAIKTHSV